MKNLNKQLVCVFISVSLILSGCSASVVTSPEKKSDDSGEINIKIGKQNALDEGFEDIEIKYDADSPAFGVIDENDPKEEVVNEEYRLIEADYDVRKISQTLQVIPNNMDLGYIFLHQGLVGQYDLFNDVYFNHSIDLFHYLEDTEDGNFVFSPYGILNNLETMLYFYHDGYDDSRYRMTSWFLYDNVIHPNFLNIGFQRLNSIYTTHPVFNYTGLWYHNSRFMPAYEWEIPGRNIDLAEDYAEPENIMPAYTYGRTEEDLSYTTSEYLTDWIERQVPYANYSDIPEKVDNTVSFTAGFYDDYWESDPCPEYVQGEVFHGMNGDADCLLAHFNENLRYFESSGAYCAVKPFRDSAFDFMVIVPKEDSEAYMKGLSAKTFRTLFFSARPRNVELYLPRFNVQSDIDVREFLKSTDDLSLVENVQGTSICRDTLTFEELRNLAYFSLNGRGAKSYDDIRKKIDLPEPSEDFTRLMCNTPFIYAVVDSASGYPVLMGAVKDL